MNKQMNRRSVVTTIVVCLVCLIIVTGSTFSLFTDYDELNIAITSGEVKLTAEINQTSTSVNELYTNLQQIITDIDNLEHRLIDVNAYINSGLLYTDDAGVPIYGLEVGQRNVIDGAEVFNKYARFISNRLSFYDENDTEVAYVSDYKLYITNAEITGSLKLGRYVIDTSDGLIIKWV